MQSSLAPLPEFVQMKHIAQRHGVTQNAIIQAIDQLPEPALRIGRLRLWRVEQWPEIDSVMRRRAERRHNRVSAAVQAAVA